MGGTMMQETPMVAPRSTPQEASTPTSQDRFLRTLLLPKEPYLSSLSGSLSGSISGSVSGSISSSENYLCPMSSRNLDGFQSSSREEMDGSYSTSSHSTEKLNQSTDSDRDSCNSVRENHAYKLKHNIMKRFSQEEKREHHLAAPSSDTSSSSSREDEKEKVKRKYPRHKTRPHSSDCSSIHSSSSGNSEVHVTSNIPLPAFVLNPDGTHYLPICIHPTFLDNIFPKKEQGKHSIYHPISIPVNFDGPYVAMPRSPLSQPCGVQDGGMGKEAMPGIPEVNQ